MVNDAHRTWVLFLAVAILFVVAAPLAGAQVGAEPAAVSPGSTVAGKPILFEVVSIRMSKAEYPGGYGFTADGFDIKGMPPAFLISMAYQFTDFDRLAGLQGWCLSERYDIRAKVADPDVAAWGMLDSKAKAMALRALLEDRLRLKVHRETREGKVYELIVAKNGPKLKDAAPVEIDPAAPPRQGGVVVGDHASSMDYLASTLPNRGVTRPVVNKTGLTGKYDFDLRILPDPDAPQGAPVTLIPRLLTLCKSSLGSI